MKRIVLLGLMALPFLGLSFTGTLCAQSSKDMTSLQSLELFQQVLVTVRNQYHRKVETQELVKDAITGMLNALDPYSEYMEPDQANELKIRTQGEFGGIGIHIGMTEGHLTVMSTIEGTPAQRLGMMAGDRFLKISGKSAEGLTIQDAVDQLRGAPGTTVNIEMGREGVKDPMPYTVTREIIKIHAVPYAGIVAPGIAYVRLADFSQDARQELMAAVDSLVRKEKAGKLIFDLRANGGGLLEQGYEVGELFLPKGDTIVTTAGQTPMSRRVFIDTDPRSYTDLPMVVLVDRGTASASEIVAGALQDMERAVVVGETTFGKGTVQSPMPLPNGTTLKLTTALWRTPSGRCVDIRTGRDTANKQQDSIFYTHGPNRRLIRGWSGIVPDVYVPYERLSDFEAKIRGEWYFDFAVKYSTQHADLKRPLTMSQSMFDDFKSYLRDKKFEFTEAQIDSARDDIARAITINIAAKLWGTAGEYEARLPVDVQVKKAVEMLGKAETEQKLFDQLPGSTGQKKTK